MVSPCQPKAHNSLWISWLNLTRVENSRAPRQACRAHLIIKTTWVTMRSRQWTSSIRFKRTAWQIIRRIHPLAVTTKLSNGSSRSVASSTWKRYRWESGKSSSTPTSTSLKPKKGALSVNRASLRSSTWLKPRKPTFTASRNLSSKW